MDLTDIETGDVITITLESGETFENAGCVDVYVVHAEDSIDRTDVSITLEGDWWEQVNDRVESEVLHLRQTSDRGGSPMNKPVLWGTVYEGEENHPEGETLGTVSDVERDTGE